MTWQEQEKHATHASNAIKAVLNELQSELGLVERQVLMLAQNVLDQRAKQAQIDAKYAPR